MSVFAVSPAMDKQVSLIEALRADHAELEKLARIFRRMLACHTSPSELELDEFLQTFSRKILFHLYREDAMLYPQLLNSKQRFVAAMAQAFIHEMGGLLDAFTTWALRWPTKRALTEWQSFCVETATILDALELRIESENQKLYPLIEKAADCQPKLLAGLPDTQSTQSPVRA